MLENKRIVVTGGTGSLGYALVKRLLAGDLGIPERIVVFSRDEAKQHALRLMLRNQPRATDDVIFRAVADRVHFQIGDVASYRSVCSVLRGADIVFHAAALKQVPTCEYFPFQTVQTNVMGAENIVRAIRDLDLPVETVVGISTDKACKPVNVMGMTKAIQERIFVQANMHMATRFVIARYGNVLASRGSVLPLFHDQIRRGGPVTLTAPEMTRFLMSLDQAVETVLSALRSARRGETFVPKLASARMVDVARTLIGDRSIEVSYLGVRPGEKMHEVLVSDEEANRTLDAADHFAVLPLLPELRETPRSARVIGLEYSSQHNVLDLDGVHDLLRNNRLLVEDEPRFGESLISEIYP